LNNSLILIFIFFFLFFLFYLPFYNPDFLSSTFQMWNRKNLRRRSKCLNVKLLFIDFIYLARLINSEKKNYIYLCTCLFFWLLKCNLPLNGVAIYNLRISKIDFPKDNNCKIIYKSMRFGSQLKH
jgi:hypothetical protein